MNYGLNFKAQHRNGKSQSQSFWISNQKQQPEGCQGSKQNLCAAVTVKMLQEDAKHKPVSCGRGREGERGGSQGTVAVWGLVFPTREGTTYW